MAKLTPVVLPDQKPSFDGTFPVKIRVGHKSANAYIDTSFSVGKKDLSKGKIRTSYIVENLSSILSDYSEAVKKIKWKLSEMSASDIKQYLLTLSAPVPETKKIDFLPYFKGFIDTKKQENIYHATFVTAYNALTGYVGKHGVLATDVTSKFLVGFEKHLKAKASDKAVSVHNIMRDLRTVFNSCADEFNDEDTGLIVIPNNPYKKYKLPKTKASENRDLSVKQVVKVRDAEVIADSRTELARDLAMLSFYLCGMNAADLYEGARLVGGRIEYNRSKTKEKRKDSAFISILLVKEAEPLWQKYISSKVLLKRYSSVAGLNAAIKKGMDNLRVITGIDFLQFYSFRHSFSTIARNDCRFSKDDIALAMNHVDSSHKVTDIYIRKDWSIIDDVQKGVISALNSPDKEQKGVTLS